MMYYQLYGNAPAFQNTITTNPPLDEKIQQLVEGFGFHSDGFAAARRQLESLLENPPQQSEENSLYMEALTAFLNAWCNCQEYKE